MCTQRERECVCVCVCVCVCGFRLKEGKEVRFFVFVVFSTVPSSLIPFPHIQGTISLCVCVCVLCVEERGRETETERNVHY
jgi:hypothetical protein